MTMSHINGPEDIINQKILEKRKYEQEKSRNIRPSKSKTVKKYDPSRSKGVFHNFPTRELYGVYGQKLSYGTYKKFQPKKIILYENGGIGKRIM